MKYFLIPVAKFIWAVILTYIAIIVNIISIVSSAIWHLKLYKGIAFEPEMLVSNDELASPYAKSPQRGYVDVYNTYFHYIWGIKNEKESC